MNIPDFDPYEVLGVGRDANAKEIKTNYYKLCLQFHPDKAGPGASEKFHQIQEAYELLSDETERARYDR
ncbi:hypothetical protein M426DRAFT_67047, partial [Hypoxylon sp. CI-4A]